MEGTRRLIAATELLLLFPAGLFLTAVLSRQLEPLQYAAQQIVTWYTLRNWTLWVLLIGMPLAALLTGGITLWWNANARSAESQAAMPSTAPIQAHLSTRLIAAATLGAGLILAVVGLHILAN